MSSLLKKVGVTAVFAVAPIALWSSPALASDSYEVVKGDTLSEIGVDLGVPWRDIAEQNNISAPWTIYPDQKLIIPGEEAGEGGAVDLDSVKVRIATTRYGLTKSTQYTARKAAALLGPKFGIEHIGGFATSGHVKRSDHYDGMALDLGLWGVSSPHKTGDALAKFTIKHHEELSVKYVIWDRQIWFPGEGWRDYHGESDHTDHVHVSFK